MINKKNWAKSKKLIDLSFFIQYLNFELKTVQKPIGYPVKSIG
jgi:hypothetical protein